VSLHAKVNIEYHFFNLLFKKYFRVDISPVLLTVHISLTFLIELFCIMARTEILQIIVTVSLYLTFLCLTVCDNIASTFANAFFMGSLVPIHFWERATRWRNWLGF
jgi:hypothetical protein